MSQSTTGTSPIPLPDSPLYELRSTQSSGRAVFATSNIPANTLVLSTASSTPASDEHTPSPDTSPLAWLIQRPYRKEACADCFAYNRGREWKLKVPDHDCGVVFCSQSCLDSWLARNGEVGVQAWAALETGVKAILKRRANDNSNDIEMRDVSIEYEPADPDGPSHNRSSSNPSDDAIEQAWTDTKLIGEVIVTARSKERQSKTERKVLRHVIDDGGDPDIMYYLLTATITASNTFKPSQYTHNHDPPPNISSLLNPLFHLAPTSTAYLASHTSLPIYTTSHLYLLTLLPLPLTPFLTPTLSHNLNTRAAHNAFSIRPTSNTDGPDSGEFLGWAVYPAASFFNHSCAPNLRKVRTGRVWEFHTVREVAVGEELCITYLGGEEETLGVVERRERLRGEWGFVCGCGKCRKESGEAEGGIGVIERSSGTT